LVAAGLAVASGASYVSLVHGEFGSRGAAQTRSMDGAASPSPATTDSIDQLASYLDATFGSLPAGERAARDTTASLAPPLAFAARFAGVATDPTDSAADPGVKSVLRSMIKPAPAPKTRAAALRIDGGAPASQDTYQVASYASGADDGLATRHSGCALTSAFHRSSRPRRRWSRLTARLSHMRARKKTVTAIRGSCCTSRRASMSNARASWWSFSTATAPR
jgi:hypothetical protein